MNEYSAEDRLDVRALARFLGRSRQPLLLMACLGALAGLGWRWIAAPIFVARAQVLLLQPVPAAGGGESSYEMTQQSYAALAEGPELLEKALLAAGASLSPAAAASGGVQLRAQALKDTRLLELEARAPSAQDAALIANEAARQFIELCKRLRTQEILDKRQLLAADLEALEKSWREAHARQDELLNGTDLWTAAGARAEVLRLRAEDPNSPRIQRLRDFLRNKREPLESLEFQSLKLDRLGAAYAQLMQESQSMGNTMNQRLAQPIFTSEASAPLAPIGPGPLGAAGLGALLALLFASGLLAFWALATRAHLTPP